MCVCVCGCVLKPEHVVLLTDRTEQKSPHENIALFIYHSARAYRGLQNKQLKDVMLTERDNHCVLSPNLIQAWDVVLSTVDQLKKKKKKPKSHPGGFPLPLSGLKKKTEGENFFLDFNDRLFHPLRFRRSSETER